MPSICSRLKLNGTPCGSMAMRGFKTCFFHASDEEVAELKRKQDTNFDLRAELQRQFKIVRNAHGSPIEKARLLLDITKLIQDLEKPDIVIKEEMPEKGETVQEYAKRLRGK
jgi:hypothetical protein